MPGLSNRLDEFSGKAFEDLVLGLLADMGLEIVEKSAGADGGVDLVARSRDPITGGLYIVQCKRQKAAIGAPIVRDLFGVVSSRKANKGILIATSRFTAAATEFANGNPIELIDGESLRRLIAAHGGDSVALMLGTTPLPAEMQQFARIVTSEARAVVARIRDQRSELEKGLRLTKRKELKDVTAVGEFVLAANRRLAEALDVLGNQARAFSGCVNHKAPPREVKRVFALYAEVVDEILGLQRSLYSACPILASEIPAAYPEADRQQRNRFARLADYNVQLIEGGKRIIGLPLAARGGSRSSP